VAAYTGATTLVMALVGLGAAQSAFGLTEIYAYVISPGDHSATATCPPGSHVVSGGGKTGVIPATLGQTALNASHKSGNGWTATGYSFHDNQTSPNHNFRVTVYAYCAQHNLHLSTFRNTTTGTPRVTTPVDCGSGYVVSGGGSVTSPYGVAFVDARRPGGWKFGADATSDGGSTIPATTQAAVYCTPNPYRLRTATASGSVDPSQIKSKTAHCPDGTRLVSGGGDAGASPYAVTWYSRRERNGWRITVTNDGPFPTTITAYAYCH
jgi:hypothetical protein